MQSQWFSTSSWRRGGSLPAAAALLALSLAACDHSAGPLVRVGGGSGAAACDDTAGVAPPTSSLGDLDELARLAIDGPEGGRAAAIETLRAAGPAGLDAFVGRWRSELAAPLPAPTPAPAKADDDARGWRWPVAADRDDGADRSARIDDALDAICQQRGCRFSQLYWHTDLDAALAAARAENKPVLSLRLLGELDETLSCANSRLFRTILYPALAPWLRERFILHWQSERPAPVITVDYGDGRRLQTTITGNSVHYVLDAEGRPVDAIPGLLAPPVFQRLLERAAALALTTSGRPPAAKDAMIREHHRQRLEELDAAWEAEVRAIGEDPRRRRPPPGPRIAGRAPRAAEAMPLAVSKMRVEMPLLNGVGLGGPSQEETLWGALADRHVLESRLSEASLRAMSALETIDPAKRARSERDLALDSVQNEHQLHRIVHGWFTAGTAPAALEALNRRVYDQLFLTPGDDPSLGMAGESVFAGLPGGGWVGGR